MNEIFEKKEEELLEEETAQDEIQENELEEQEQVPNEVPSVINERTEELDVEETEKTEEPKLLSQEEVNALVGKTRQEARERALREVYERFGIENENALNELVGRGQSYQILDEDFQRQSEELENVRTENALLHSNIDPQRWDDVKLIIKGKGMEVNFDTIQSLLPTHPEWSKQQQQTISNELNENDLENFVNKRPSQIRKIGNEIPPQMEQKVDDEEERVKKLYGY